MLAGSSIRDDGQAQLAVVARRGAATGGDDGAAAGSDEMGLSETELSQTGIAEESIRDTDGSAALRRSEYVDSEHDAEA